jgi:hypothetical protein
MPARSLPQERNVQASIFLARLLGPLLLLVGISIPVNTRAFEKMGREILGSVTLVFLFGVLDFAAGLAIVLTHNVWVANWPVLITLIGWMLLIRGAVRVLITEKVMGFGLKVLSNKRTFSISAGALCVLGLALCYFGYRA